MIPVLGRSRQEYGRSVQGQIWLHRKYQRSLNQIVRPCLKPQNREYPNRSNATIYWRCYKQNKGADLTESKVCTDGQSPPICGECCRSREEARDEPGCLGTDSHIRQQQMLTPARVMLTFGQGPSLQTVVDSQRKIRDRASSPVYQSPGGGNAHSPLIIFSPLLNIVKTSAEEESFSELNKANHNGHAKVDEEKPIRPQLYSKNYRQPMNAESGRKSLPQGRTHQLDIQYQKKKRRRNLSLAEKKVCNKSIEENKYLC